MNITKRPYEISLWEDQLVWQRLELEAAQVSEEDYRPGAFFSQDPTVLGAIPYSLDNEPYRVGQRYYRFKADGKCLEGDGPNSVVVDNSWKSNSSQYEVRNPMGQWDADEWYVYSNSTNRYTRVNKSNTPTPAKDVIYYKEISSPWLPNVVQSFFKETKLATIGTNTMESPARCVNPKLTRKVNGENTLVFTMYYRYWDDEAQNLVYNPFNQYMVNERKVKLRVGPAASSPEDDCCKWYDFVIKNVQENSESKAFTYTCKDQFVNELSKTGFEIELDNELENNMGTIDQLGEYILEGSDWKLDYANTSNLKQYKEEPLYEIWVDSSVNMTATKLEAPLETMSIKGKRIFVFYSDIVEQKKTIQFLYSEVVNNENKVVFAANDDLVIDKDYPNWVLDGVTYDAEKPTFANNMVLTTSYRGQKLVKQAQTKYDSTIDKYVGVYTKNIDESIPVFSGESWVSALQKCNLNGSGVNVNEVNKTVEFSPGYMGSTNRVLFDGFKKNVKYKIELKGRCADRNKTATDLRLYYSDTEYRDFSFVFDSETAQYGSAVIVTDLDKPPISLKVIYQYNYVTLCYNECAIYEIEDTNKYYGFTQSEYLSSGLILNYAANPSNFTSTTGWQTDSNQLELSIKTNPEGPLTSEFKTYESFLNFKTKENAWLLNTGIGGHRSSIGSFTKGDKYVVRIKYKKGSAAETKYETASPDIRISEFIYGTDSKYLLSSPVFKFEKIMEEINTNDINVTGEYEAKTGYVYLQGECLYSISKTQLTDWDFKIGLFLKFDEPAGTDIFIEDLQVFPYQIHNEDGRNRLCVPGGKLYSEIKTKYVYYLPNSEWTSESDLIVDYEGYEPSEMYSQTYSFEANKAETNEFTKVRSISGKESNRFNLIQELCEAFECWPRFSVKRNQQTGKIYYGKDLGLQSAEAYRQQKFLSFHEFAGKDNYVGFRYGVNSKSIQRTVDSATITTKMIVKDNANEFAPNGFCSIARASENPSGENFLINFNHYYRHNLLDIDIVTNDFYVNANGYLGYYTQLKSLNSRRNIMIEDQANLLKVMAQLESSYTTYKTSYDSAVEEQLVIVQDTSKLIGVSNLSDFAGTVSGLLNSDSWKDNSKLLSYWVKWTQCQNIIVEHEEKYKIAKINLDQAKSDYDALSKTLNELTQKKRELNLQFYKKYSRFIQEGSWIKEDYTDHNLYYIDAESTLNTSAQPKVTYNISVIDISMLEGYEVYDFDVGDKTYIEDVEFFGWSLRDNKTPYREEIVVNEMVTELDAPEKDQIKVQNYKTQFEDLFQRITASTQQAEYHTGEYARAASIVQNDGTISTDTLQGSFENNSFKLTNARDQSIRWDESGITTTCLTNPSEMVRIISGGIFLSNDGGATWKTGVTGSGINTQYLTAGQINTNEIYIMNGNDSAFRWDNLGLAAYWATDNGYDTNRFVRFDHNGIYGILANDEWTGKDEDIHNNASFALTWSGFSLKNTDGSVRISTDEDIQVLQRAGEEEISRVKIGRLGTFKPEGTNQDEIYYGIRICDDQKNVILETAGDGDLWLKGILKIHVKGNPDISIGNLTDNEVINACDNFIVTATGKLIANEAEIKGNIEAKFGKLGNVAISSSEEGSYLTVNQNDTFFINFMKDGNSFTALEISKDGLVLQGQIIAQDGGDIGGFQIRENQLVSKDGTSIILDGTNGKITAKNIELGEGATITSHMALGNATIKNPDKNNRIFIEADNITIYDTGEIKVGDITIDGSKSEISGEDFSITPNSAQFNNIIASGKITCSVFETEKTQAIGGAMLFLPSYKIKSCKKLDSYIFKIDDNIWYQDGGIKKSRIEKDSIVWITNGSNTYNEGIVIDIDAEKEEIYIRIEGNNLVANPLILIDLGTGSNQQIIGINSGRAPAANGYLRPCGLTMSARGDATQLPNLFLGDLSSVGLSGYGLYSDNVYLRGSLIASPKDKTGKCAGISTTGKATGDKEMVGSEGNIIFWAGSDSEEASDIKKAPFQVTEDGYVYLANALYAGGIISGAELRAPIIRGWNSESGKDVGLTIYNANKGISFKSKTEESETEVFSIGSSGFKINDSEFIKIANGQAVFKTCGDEYLSLQKININSKEVPALYHHHNQNKQCGWFFEDGSTSFNFINGENLSTTMVLTATSTAVNGQIDFDTEAGTKMQFKPNNNGYDLYVI